jgi:flagellar biogenesis protein FliO
LKTLVLFLAAITSLDLSAADVTIKGAELANEKGTQARLSIKHAGIINDNPRILVNDKNLSITIPNSGLGSKINQKINGTSLSATMSGEETVSINVALPYSLKGRETEVAITLKDGAIDVSYPRIDIAKKTAAGTSRAPGITEKAIVLDTAAINAEAEHLDESYLSSLVTKQDKLIEKKQASEVAEAKIADQGDTDRVNLTQSAVAKTASATQSTGEQTAEAPKSNFSVVGYIGKFVAFLAVMIAGFYGVLTLFKKGIIKKGKLGFLNSTKLIEVLSTTHIAPKKSLIMVKAHKQVFLISNTEAGMTLVSEIKDVAGLLKNGEEEIAGSNFDTNLYTANKASIQFKLKEVDTKNSYGDDDYEMDSLDDMLNDSVPAKNMKSSAGNKTQTNALASIEKTPVQDQVRFSDTIKNKVKNLKQL